MWARNGLTMVQIASNLGISKDTLYQYIQRYSDFSDALKVSRDEADAQVINAMHQSATGYEYEEDAVTPSGKVVRVHKYHVPNVSAQIFWLKNRRPSEWRDKQEVQHEMTQSLADILTAAWKQGSDDGGSKE